MGGLGQGKLDLHYMGMNKCNREQAMLQRLCWGWRGAPAPREGLYPPGPIPKHSLQAVLVPFPVLSWPKLRFGFSAPGAGLYPRDVKLSLLDLGPGVGRVRNGRRDCTVAAGTRLCSPSHYPLLLVGVNGISPGMCVCVSSQLSSALYW